MYVIVKYEHSSILILNLPVMIRKSSRNMQNLQERQPLRDLLRGLSPLELHADPGIQTLLGTHGLPESVAIMNCTPVFHLLFVLFHSRLEKYNTSGSSGGDKIIIIQKSHPIHFKLF